MSKTSAEKQRDYRARQSSKIALAKTAGKRITRLLVDHPEKMAKFDAFMVQMNREMAESRRRSQGQRTGAKVSVDGSNSNGSADQ